MKTLIFAAGLSGNHNLIGTMLRFLFARPKKIFYCCYKIFDNEKFEAWLKKQSLSVSEFESFHLPFKITLNQIASMKKKNAK